MDYIVYDTEFSQPQPKLYNPNSRFKPNPISPFEIIEIGAVKVSADFQITDTFTRLIKPVIYSRLSPIVMRKTGIRPHDVQHGIGFTQAVEEFLCFCGKDFILCSWSSNDVQILQKNCHYHKFGCTWLEPYYDIQKHATAVLGYDKNQTVGLKNALTALSIDVEGRLHRALEDAYYTAQVFIRVHSEEMQRQLDKTAREVVR